MISSDRAPAPIPRLRKDSRRLNVLLVKNRVLGGEPADPVACLASGLARLGLDVLVASRSGQIEGIVRISMGDLRRALHGGAADIVQVDSPGAALAVSLARGNLPIPIVGSARDLSGWSWPWAAWAFNLVCDRVVAGTDHVRDLLIAGGLPRAKAVTIHDGVRTERFAPPADLAGRRIETRAELGIPAGASVVGTLALHGDAKGPVLLLDAIGRLEPCLRPRVLIAAPTSIRGEIEAHAQILGLSGPAFLGPLDGQERLLAAADAFCLPVVGAKRPLGPIAEAMAAGLPVVATTAPGVPEIVIHGGTGFLVHPQDIGGLGNALSRLLAEPSLGQRMGRFGRDVALADFSVDAMCRRYEAVYSDLLTGAARGRAESIIGGPNKSFSSCRC